MARERRVSGKRVDDFPRGGRRAGTSAGWPTGTYLLRKGRDFDVEVESLVIAARRWAREHGYKLTTRCEFDERQEGRSKVGLYVRSIGSVAVDSGGPPVRRHAVHLTRRRLIGHLLRLECEHEMRAERDHRTSSISAAIGEPSESAASTRGGR
jgi:hypothetical protein